MDHKGNSSTTMVTPSPSKAKRLLVFLSQAMRRSSDHQVLSATCKESSNDSDAVRGKFNGFKLEIPPSNTPGLTSALQLQLLWNSLKTPSLDPCMIVDMTAGIKVHICWNHTPKRSFCSVFLILQPFESISGTGPFLQDLLLVVQLIFPGSQDVTQKGTFHLLS